ncbi:MAG: protein translocase subunit SecD [Clostridiales bacterium]|nr:protein translocase subunit SecD [Clostridiales bacterium]
MKVEKGGKPNAGKKTGGAAVKSRNTNTKVHVRRKLTLSKRTSAIIALSITLALTLFVGYLGLNGAWLDSRGLWKLLPWLPNADVENWPQSIALGLDLKGGVYVEYEAKMSESMASEGHDFNYLLDNTISIMGQRLTEKGYPEATVSRLGTSGIRVEIPDVTDPAAVLNLIGSPAKLEFLDPEGNVFLEGRDLQAAYPTKDEDGKPAITFKLNTEGAEVFGDMTAKNVGKTITIQLDGETLMAPSVQTAIYGGNVLITGDFTAERAQDIALQLQSGALPLELRQDKLDTISATLGIDALSTSVTAAVIGILLVMLLIAIRYRLCGILADWALVVYIILMFLLIAIVPGIQLTLPGIAGIILSIGMAVDANVVIFERVKEEVKAGRPMTYATRMGFKNAMSAVLDSNITTIIAAVVLLMLGTGSVQGFATTLLLGVLSSMVTAILFSRFLMKRMVRIIQNPRLYVAGLSKLETAQTANGEAK